MRRPAVLDPIVSGYGLPVTLRAALQHPVVQGKVSHQISLAAVSNWVVRLGLARSVLLFPVRLLRDLFLEGSDMPFTMRNPAPCVGSPVR